jgi:transposase-like protein
MEARSLGDVCEELRQEVAAEVRSAPGRRWRSSADLRSRVVSYARVCREGGAPVRDIAERLGLVESTLARWLRAERPTVRGGFRQVAIMAAGEAAETEGAAALSLITPRGYRVEGLDPRTLAFLLRVVE